MFHHSESGVASTFVEALGASAVVSPPTNRRILERGVSLATDESCLPVKIHLGHVDAIASSVDRMLVPRYASQEAGHDDTCVKSWATYDITRNVFPDLDVVGYDVDTRFGKAERGALLKFGRDLGASRAVARNAWQYADERRAADRHTEQIAQEELLETDTRRPRVLVVGHRYILDDALMGEPALSFLGKQDVTVLRSDRVDIPRCRELAQAFSPTLKWVYNQEQVGAILALRERIHGVVLLVSFPCGPDSLCAELIQRRVSELPVCVIVLDELTGTGGLHTRLESFCDIVKMRYADG